MGIIGAIFLFLLKTLLWVLAVLIVLLLIVLITPVKISFVYPDTEIYVKWNGIKYKLYPMKKRPKKEKKPKEKQGDIVKADKDILEQKPAIEGESRVEKTTKKPKEKPKLLQNLTKEKIKSILKIVFSLSKRLLKAITFEQLYVVLTMANEDKAKLAQNYGQVCALLTQTQPVFEKVFTVKDQHINVGLDFARQETVIAADVIVYVRPVTLLITALSALIKIKKEGII